MFELLQDPQLHKIIELLFSLEIIFTIISLLNNSCLVNLLLLKCSRNEFGCKDVIKNINVYILYKCFLNILSPDNITVNKH